MSDATAMIMEDLRLFLVRSFPELANEIGGLTAATGLWQTVPSLSLLELVDYIEGKYGIKVEVLEFVPDTFDSLERIARFVVRKSEGG